MDHQSQSQDVNRQCKEDGNSLEAPGDPDCRSDSRQAPEARDHAIDALNIAGGSHVEVPDHLQHRPKIASPNGAVEVDEDEHDACEEDGAVQ